MSASRRARLGIFGLETECPFFHVEDAGARNAREGPPPFPVLEEVLWESLLEGRKWAPALDVKGGCFLENGGRLYLELAHRSQEEVPILESATPECRSPEELIAYSRVYDAILEEAGRRSAVRLRERGYAGRIAFGKNNVDSRGTGYGSHENYLVHGAPPSESKWVAALLAPLAALAFFPPFCLWMIAVLGAGLASVFRRLTGRPGGGATPGSTQAGRSMMPQGVGGSPRFAQTLGNLRAAAYGFAGLVLRPGACLLAAFVRGFAWGPFISGLLPFLVTRPIFAGAGRLNFRARTYELSQRAEDTRGIVASVTVGRLKRVFDMKHFLFDPMGLFRDQRRLTVTIGDSNLSDTAGLLKVGTTALCIEAIEGGVSFEDLRLAHPLRALRQVSRSGPLKLLDLRSGGSMTAIDIQRQYLRRTEEYIAKRRDPVPARGALWRLWGETLDVLATRPMTLSRTLDWVAKKTLLDEAVLARTNWKAFFAWGEVLDRAGLESAARAGTLEHLIALAPVFRRRAIARLAKREALDPTEFELHRELHFQARKIDLKYHELGRGEGYERAMEARGLLDRRVDDETILRCLREPPQGTRALVRSRYIRAARGPESLRVQWDEIEFPETGRRISLPNPLSAELPTEGPA